MKKLEIEKECNRIVKQLSKTAPKFYVKSKEGWWNWLINPIAMYKDLKTRRVMCELISYQYEKDKKHINNALRDLLVTGNAEYRGVTFWNRELLKNKEVE